MPHISKTRKRQLAQRGRHCLIPIIGDKVVEFRVGTSCLPTLLFCGEDGVESRLEIAQTVDLRRGEWTTTLEGAKPGITYDPTQVQPLLELIGTTVIDAVAQEDGVLRLDFSNKLELEITPVEGEGWHFQTQDVYLHGADGHLI